MSAAAAPAAGAAGAGAGSANGAPLPLRSTVFSLGVRFKHENDEPLSEFLGGASGPLGQKDMSKPLQVLDQHWVRDVGDVRLLVQEGLLRSIGLPLRLCVWMEEEAAAHEESKRQGPKKQVFRYTRDFDTNGIVYHLATAGLTQPWSNPAQSGAVKVASSGMLADSVSEAAVVGRDTVRCVTNANPNAWISIDFVDKWVTPTAYTLRHYSSWDTEALRSWVLEGSNDGLTWTVLRQHVNDESLHGIGSTFTWTIQSPTASAYQSFRIRMTGPNSHNHMYLACSGFEIYGTLYYERPSPEEIELPIVDIGLRRDEAKVAGGAAARSFSLPQNFSPTAPFDGRDIVAFLATSGFTGPYVNPALTGHVQVTASSVMQGSEPITAVVGDKVVRCVTRAEPNSWIVVDFLDKRVSPTHYGLRHYSSWDTEALRSWRFEASNDGNNWTVLREHKQDMSLNGKGSKCTWPLPPKFHSMPFKYFRIFQTGVNSNKHHYLACSGFEIYGTLSYADEANRRVSVAASPAAVPAPASSPPPASASASASAAAAAAAEAKMRSGTPTPNPGPAADKDKSVFVYESDLDHNGLMYYLATDGYTKPWVNPAVAGRVAVSASSLMGDSVPLTEILGREVVRCVTKPHPNSWMAVDLLDKTIAPTHYTLRHYSSWDVEALRNWNFEGSNDGVTWTLIRRHTDDQSLNARGATQTWALPDVGQSFRILRIFQWGINSNKHNYLSLSGFEVYGRVTRLPPALRANSAAAAAAAGANAVFVSGAASAGAAGGGGAGAGAGAGVGAGAGAAAGAAANAGAAAGQMTWNSQVMSAFLDVDEKSNEVRNRGSSDKWQMARSAQALSSGKQRCAVRIKRDAPTTNTWKFIVGVIPSSFPAGGKEWVGAHNSWGYIGGTGGKCHQVAKSVPYGAPFGDGDVVGIELDFDASTIEFFKNGAPQGVAFNNLSGPVHLAVSFTGTGTAFTIADTNWENLAKPLPAPGQLWDPQQKSRFVEVDVAKGIAINKGSQDKWQSVRSVRSFSEGRCSFSVEIVESPPTPNNWRFIVGVVPPSFPLTWVGAAESWGYIGGTGGKCFNVGTSTPYGDTYGAKGDVIRVILDFDSKTIEFAKNGVSQGVAFNNLTGPVFAAVSLTATNSAVRLIL